MSHCAAIAMDVNPSVRKAAGELATLLDDYHYSPHARDRIVRYTIANGTPSGCPELDREDEADASMGFEAELEPVPFTRGNAAEFGRQGGRSPLARHGPAHMAEIGRLGFAALARRRGFMGGARLGALQWLLSKGKMSDRGPDQCEAIAWSGRVLEG